MTDPARSAGQAETLHGWLYNIFFVPYMSPKNASLAFAVFFVALILMLVWPLYHKKIFVRV